MTDQHLTAGSALVTFVAAAAGLCALLVAVPGLQLMAGADPDGSGLGEVALGFGAALLVTGAGLGALAAWGALRAWSGQGGWVPALAALAVALPLAAWLHLVMFTD